MKEKKTKQKISLIKTYPVPYTLKNKKVNISISTDEPSKYSEEYLINQAFKFHSQGNISEASKYYQHFINQGFINSHVLSNYGNILKDLGNLDEAEILTRNAIKIKPDNAIAHYNLGGILIAKDKLKEAEVSTQKAIELKPDYIKAHYNLGNIYLALGQLEKAEMSTRKAIQYKSNYAEAYFHLSLIQLLQGNYTSGLENYEYRFKQTKPILPHAYTKLNRVRDGKFHKEKDLLILSEQGLGDTIQFMRYIPYLKKQGFNITFCAQEKLHSLIKESKIDQNPLLPDQANKVLNGEWIQLLSLPRYLKINPGNPIINEPYIFSSHTLINKWRDILCMEKRPIIGINWQGNSNAEQGTILSERSFVLETFSIIASDNNIKFLSLQKGFGSEQLKECSFKNKFVESQKHIDSIWDFHENAAIIENCDLIITCDTSIAHLAGGMGKSTWTLLNYCPEWRWGMEGEKTFWYPSMRLFRQKERNNWNEVMMRVSSEIKKEIKKITI